MVDLSLSEMTYSYRRCAPNPNQWKPEGITMTAMEPSADFPTLKGEEEEETQMVMEACVCGKAA